MIDKFFQTTGVGYSFHLGTESIIPSIDVGNLEFLRIGWKISEVINFLSKEKA